MEQNCAIKFIVYKFVNVNNLNKNVYIRYYITFIIYILIIIIIITFMFFLKINVTTT